MDEQTLMRAADLRAATYLESVSTRRVFPDADAIAALAAFAEPLSAAGQGAQSTLTMLDDLGSPGTVASNGPNYFGFVIGASLPAAAAAERLLLAWDQCASAQLNSPTAAMIEKVATGWLLEILDLPRDSAVGFGTSATACSIACLSTARRSLLARLGWNFDQDGLFGAPEITVVVSATVHITVLKALRILGFGMARLVVAPTDSQGRIDPARLPVLSNQTILRWWPGRESNPRHGDFQSPALPTELPSH